MPPQVLAMPVGSTACRHQQAEQSIYQSLLTPTTPKALITDGQTVRAITVDYTQQR